MPPDDSLTRLWRIELLGGLRVVGAERVITRFRSRQTGALLAYLAFYLQRAHPREVLIELIWPELDVETGRDRLRVALSSLRRQLEPPGIASGCIILAGRRTVQLNPATVSTDVGTFEAAIQSAGTVSDAGERAEWLGAAVEQYRGELLPGCYEGWIQPERQRLADGCFQAARELIRDREQRGDFTGALEIAGRAVAADPLREEAHQELIRLYLHARQPARARQQLRELQRLLRKELGEEPSPATARLFREIEPRQDRLLERANPAAPAEREEEQTLLSPEALLPPKASFPVVPEGAEHVHAGHLPLPLTRFFGRDAEIVALHHWLAVDDARLITLTGSGGSGKTRLAMEAARRLPPAKQGAVWWVPLLDLAEAGLIADAVRDAMRLPRSPNVPAAEQIVAALAEMSRPVLLLLDNFEHLVDGGASIVRELLERAANLRCLVTSRQLLNLAGEREFRVEPLPVPVEGVGCRGWGVGSDQVGAGPYTPPPTPYTLITCPSVELFVDRAQMTRADFQVTSQNATAVAELCCRLEGIPLAIELAAARIRLLTPAQMLNMLGRRFDLLVSRRRDLPPRHQSLRTAIEWSYRLLSPELQSFFDRLSVFRGGWTLEAAHAICINQPCVDPAPSGSVAAPHPAADTASPTRALEALAQLGEASLVLAEAGGEEMRYRILETLREYAGEQLSAAEREAVGRRHAAYYLALAETTEPNVHGEQGKDTQDRLEREHDNLRAAMDWFAAHGQASEGMRLGAALFLFWQHRHYWEEGQRRLSAHLALSGPSDFSRERARALDAAARLAWRRQEYNRARPLFEQSLALQRLRGDRSGAAQTLCLLGHIANDRQGGLAQANLFYEEALSQFEELGDEEEIAAVCYSLGLTAAYAGELERARQFLERQLAIARKHHRPRDLGWAFEPLVDLAYHRGDYATACAYLEERRETRRVMARETGIALQSDTERAPAAHPADGKRVRRLLETCLAMEQELEIDWRHWAAHRRLLFSSILIEQSEFPAAQALLEQCLAVFQELGQQELVARSLHGLGTIARLQGRHEAAAAAFERGLCLARAGRFDRTIPNLLIALGMNASDRGDLAAALRLLEEGLALTRRMSHGVPIALALDAMATHARRTGDLRHARALLEEALTLSRTFEAVSPVSRTLAGLGQLHLAEGDFTAAVPLLRESLAIRWPRGDLLGVAECLEGLAAAESEPAGATSQALQRVTQLLSVAAALRESLGAPIPPTDQASHTHRAQMICATMGEASYDAATLVGRALTLDQAIAFACPESQSA